MQKESDTAMQERLIVDNRGTGSGVASLFKSQKGSR